MGDGLIDQKAGAPQAAPLHRIPRATYRIQLRHDFGLVRVRELLPYLQALGASDVYLSPLFRAREESSHGYDVVDHNAIDPAFGTLADFEQLADAVRELWMGILLDVVPNHMGINDAANRWWVDVLEHGETAEHAAYFDIDWTPAAAHLQHKVLLPFLGAPFGETLESGQLRVVVADGRLQLAYGDKRFPLARSTWPSEITVVLDASTADAAALEGPLAELNGRAGEPRSFDRLEALLDAQAYRLAYWRVAADEINYRRFFDINDLAAIRVEDPAVFDDVHRLVSKFLAAGWITGLRIDHPDGLLDPEAYFQRLQSLARHSASDGSASAGGAAAERLYVVAEKILATDELLPVEWAISGTTGYDFMNLINRLAVSPIGLAALRDNYERLTGVDESAADIAYQSKREVLLYALASELNMLASQLDRIARQHRTSRDFTRPALMRTLREFIACLPVYRTYKSPRGWEISEVDYRHIATAIRMAKRRNPNVSHAEFDFLAGVLRLENPPTLTPEQADERRQFALKVQQVTGPAMAKGLEDAAFYRYYPLASLNEVGGELDARALDAAEFHRLMSHRAAEWPHSLSASATHDTKRGEDMRARLHVLSEVADLWISSVERWQHLTRPLLVEVDGAPAPARNEMYLLFQTLVGIWPVAPMTPSQRESFLVRVNAYLQKALREAKRHSSWVSPSQPYEDAVATFLRRLLTDARAAAVRTDLANFVARIAPAGYTNGLAQLALKSTLPGVPDTYQGGEFWDFNLVDPDNRRPVDFAARTRSLEELQNRFAESPSALVAELAAGLSADRVKQFVAWRALALRAAMPDVFAHGDYTPLAVTGARAAHVFAFARQFEDRWIAVIVPQQIQCLLRKPVALAWESPDWQDTAVALPAPVAHWRNELTGATVNNAGDALGVASLLADFPLTLLSSQSS